jgi:WD40 repeat protein
VIPLAELAAVGGGGPNKAPPELVAVLGDARLRHWEQVNGVCFSPDGELLATASYDHTVRLWDAATGRLVRTLTGHQDKVNDVTFGAAGRGGVTPPLLASSGFDGTVRLASGSDDATVKVWETSAWLSRTLVGHEGNVRSVVFRPDGEVLAAAVAADQMINQMIKLWDPVTYQERGRPLRGHQAHVNAVAFHADGKVLASGSPDKTVKLWDLATGLELRTLLGHTSWVESVAFRGSSSILASASDDRTIRLWDTDTGKTLRILEGHKDHVHFVAFSPDGRRLASAGYDGTVRLWDPDSGKVLKVFRIGPPGGRIWRLAFTPDGRHLATANNDSTVYVLRLAPPPARKPSPSRALRAGCARNPIGG